ncbi:hypothetical protein J3458_005253 [Metarhizium acridum]|uniref:uncharacterized protein n=1 Tax=Metarhizium acridum TaxID=92637 RepID=UPI001C6CDD9B|nr:hypothetical protein J3458_005253 [Metarhizium acridum]
MGMMNTIDKNNYMLEVLKVSAMTGFQPISSALSPASLPASPLALFFFFVRFLRAGVVCIGYLTNSYDEKNTNTQQGGCIMLLELVRLDSIPLAPSQQRINLYSPGSVAMAIAFDHLVMEQTDLTMAVFGLQSSKSSL